jgi:hypothetical protein
VGLALALLLGCSKPEGARVEGPLALEIPELCTVCVEVLRCDGSARRVAYVLAENDSWAQIATIWDYFAAFFRPKTEDFRVLSSGVSALVWTSGTGAWSCPVSSSISAMRRG